MYQPFPLKKDGWIRCYLSDNSLSVFAIYLICFVLFSPDVFAIRVPALYASFFWIQKGFID